MGNLAILIPIVSVIAVFTFVAIATWSDNRRKEREAFYRHETYRKMLERSGEGAEAVADMMRREEALRREKRIDGLKLGGLVTAAAGLGASVFLFFLLPDEPIYLAGLIPLLIGVVIGAYGFVLASRAER